MNSTDHFLFLRGAVSIFISLCPRQKYQKLPQSFPEKTEGTFGGKCCTIIHVGPSMYIYINCVKIKTSKKLYPTVIYKEKMCSFKSAG